MAKRSKRVPNGVVHIDLDQLDDSERRRVERVLKPRNKQIGLRFNEGDIENWKAAAKAADEFFTTWIENALNAAASKVNGKR